MTSYASSFATKGGTAAVGAFVSGTTPFSMMTPFQWVGGLVMNPAAAAGALSNPAVWVAVAAGIALFATIRPGLAAIGKLYGSMTADRDGRFMIQLDRFKSALVDSVLRAPMCSSEMVDRQRRLYEAKSLLDGGNTVGYRDCYLQEFCPTDRTGESVKYDLIYTLFRPGSQRKEENMYELVYDVQTVLDNPTSFYEKFLGMSFKLGNLWEVETVCQDQELDECPAADVLVDDSLHMIGESEMLEEIYLAPLIINPRIRRFVETSPALQEFEENLIDEAQQQFSVGTETAIEDCERCQQTWGHRSWGSGRPRAKDGGMFNGAGTDLNTRAGFKQISAPAKMARMQDMMMSGMYIPNQDGGYECEFTGVPLVHTPPQPIRNSAGCKAAAKENGHEFKGLVRYPNPAQGGQDTALMTRCAWSLEHEFGFEKPLAKYIMDKIKTIIYTVMETTGSGMTEREATEKAAAKAKQEAMKAKMEAMKGGGKGTNGPPGGKADAAGAAAPAKAGGGGKATAAAFVQLSEEVLAGGRGGTGNPADGTTTSDGRKRSKASSSVLQISELGLDDHSADGEVEQSSGARDSSTSMLEREGKFRRGKQVQKKNKGKVSVMIRQLMQIAQRKFGWAALESSWQRGSLLQLLQRTGTTGRTMLGGSRGDPGAADAAEKPQCPAEARTKFPDFRTVWGDTLQQILRELKDPSPDPNAADAETHTKAVEQIQKLNAARDKMVKKLEFATESAFSDYGGKFLHAGNHKDEEASKNERSAFSQALIKDHQLPPKAAARLAIFGENMLNACRSRCTTKEEDEQVARSKAEGARKAWDEKKEGMLNPVTGDISHAIDAGVTMLTESKTVVNAGPVDPVVVSTETFTGGVKPLVQSPFSSPGNLQAWLHYRERMLGEVGLMVVAKSKSFRENLMQSAFGDKEMSESFSSSASSFIEEGQGREWLFHENTDKIIIKEKPSSFVERFFPTWMGGTGMGSSGETDEQSATTVAPSTTAPAAGGGTSTAETKTKSSSPAVKDDGALTSEELDKEHQEAGRTGCMEYLGSNNKDGTGLPGAGYYFAQTFSLRKNLRNYLTELSNNAVAGHSLTYRPLDGPAKEMKQYDPDSMQFITICRGILGAMSPEAAEFSCTMSDDMAYEQIQASRALQEDSHDQLWREMDCRKHWVRFDAASNKQVVDKLTARLKEDGCLDRVYNDTINSLFHLEAKKLKEEGKTALRVQMVRQGGLRAGADSNPAGQAVVRGIEQIHLANMNCKKRGKKYFSVFPTDPTNVMQSAQENAMGSSALQSGETHITASSSPQLVHSSRRMKNMQRGDVGKDTSSSSVLQTAQDKSGMNNAATSTRKHRRGDGGPSGDKNGNKEPGATEENKKELSRSGLWPYHVIAVIESALHVRPSILYDRDITPPSPTSKEAFVTGIENYAGEMNNASEWLSSGMFNNTNSQNRHISEWLADKHMFDVLGGKPGLFHKRVQGADYHQHGRVYTTWINNINALALRKDEIAEAVHGDPGANIAFMQLPTPKCYSGNFMALGGNMMANAKTAGTIGDLITNTLDDVDRVYNEFTESRMTEEEKNNRTADEKTSTWRYLTKGRRLRDVKVRIGQVKQEFERTKGDHLTKWLDSTYEERRVNIIQRVWMHSLTFPERNGHLVYVGRWKEKNGLYDNEILIAELLALAYQRLDALDHPYTWSPLFAFVCVYVDPKSLNVDLQMLNMYSSKGVEDRRLQEEIQQFYTIDQQLERVEQEIEGAVMRLSAVKKIENELATFKARIAERMQMEYQVIYRERDDALQQLQEMGGASPTEIERVSKEWENKRQDQERAAAKEIADFEKKQKQDLQMLKDEKEGSTQWWIFPQPSDPGTQGDPPCYQTDRTVLEGPKTGGCKSKPWFGPLAKGYAAEAFQAFKSSPPMTMYPTVFLKEAIGGSQLKMLGGDPMSPLTSDRGKKRLYLFTDYDELTGRLRDDGWLPDDATLTDGADVNPILNNA
ncbi:unnamed protein product [Amoebophrya sp. A120]|nr:unnamed protein product [Amoebophrya sp. A120]|eukprot:GSA120T00005792001.1